MKQYYIFDFDSTFIKGESLDILASIVLKKHPQSAQIQKQIEDITRRGMDGEISFSQSLRERMRLLNPTADHIAKLIAYLKKNVTLSIKNNVGFFKKYHNQIYIVSGGFRECIIPIVKPYHISKSHVLANTFIYRGNRIVGYDHSNPLAQNEGKVRAVKSLRIRGDVTIIGDGYTDLQIKEMGAASHFVAFTENVKRSLVASKADMQVPSLDEFLYVNSLPTRFSYPRNRLKVLLVENINHEAVTLFEKEGYPVAWYEKSPPQEELIQMLKNVKILGLRSRTQINKEILAASPHLITIGAYCIGTNQIDLKTATSLAVPVFNAPYSNSRSVVELAIGYIIMLLRRSMDKHLFLQNGIWDKSANGCFEVLGKTLGIIGYGNIGSQLSVLAETLGMKVYYYNRSERPALGNAIKCASLRELLGKSDIVTLHVDGDPANKNLISAKEFGWMRKDAYLLNLSRGFVVEIGALVNSLKTGHLAGAAIDVFPQEPSGQGDPFISPLRGIKNVILSPHVGGSTQEAQSNIAHFTTSKLLDYINTGNTSLSVNFPTINVAPVTHTHRLLHIHANVPGILAKINATLSKHHLNIEKQYLETLGSIGYVITDVNKTYDAQALVDLRKIKHTIRFRILY